MRNRSTAILIVLALLGATGWGTRSWAAERYPAKPIFFIVAVEAGADGDVVSRKLVQKASAILGQPIVIVNKPGAGSSIGYREVHDAKPDGYTIGWASVTIITCKLQGILRYDHQDFTPLGTFATFLPIVVASTKTKRPFKTIQEVMSFAKEHPGEVCMATSGIGQSFWIAGMAFIEGTGLEFNVIPGAGGSGTTIAPVAGGHCDIGIPALGSAKGQLEAGNLRFLASLGTIRAPGEYSSFPTMTELGYDVVWESTNMLIGPPKLPKDIADTLAKAFEKAAKDPEYVKFLTELNAVPTYLPPDKVNGYLDGRRAVVQKIMDKAGILKEKK
jgi:tripartite-type tricarboxylate transporter receptor subunit TctC